MIIERPLIVINYNWNIFNNNNNWIFELIHSICWFSLFICICIKFYLLYYYEKLNLSIINQAWQREINVGITDWFISNSQKFGNPIWLIKISIIPYVFLIAIAVCGTHFLS